MENEPEGSGQAPLANAMIGCAVVSVAMLLVFLVLAVSALAGGFGLMDWLL